MNKKAVFLDRDGTIIKDKHYLNRVSGIEFLSGVFEALKIMAGKGYLLIGVSNQSGIARGLVSENKTRQINEKIISTLMSKGIKLEKIYYCPHLPEDFCLCRKPKTGMIEEAVKEFGIDTSKSFVIGDKLSDVELALNAKAKPIIYGAARAVKGCPRIKNWRARGKIQQIFRD